MQFEFKFEEEKDFRFIVYIFFGLPGMLLKQKIVIVLFTGMTNSTHFLLQRPKYLRPFGKIYQSINADNLRAQNMETWPYFNQVIFARTCCGVLLAFLSLQHSSIPFFVMKRRVLIWERHAVPFVWHVAEIFLMCYGLMAKQFLKVGHCLVLWIKERVSFDHSSDQ